MTNNYLNLTKFIVIAVLSMIVALIVIHAIVTDNRYVIRCKDEAEYELLESVQKRYRIYKAKQ